MNKIDRNAVFCDETELFKTPYEPKTGDVTKLKIRVKKGDAKRVYVTINGVRNTMKKSNTVGVFDEFCHTFVCPDKKVVYYFTVVGDGDKTFFNRPFYLLYIIRNAPQRNITKLQADAKPRKNKYAGASASVFTYLVIKLRIY